MADQLLKLGDYSKPKPKGYFFDLYQWVEPIQDNSRNINIDPRDYFITSGEAIVKCTVLEQDLWKIYKSVLKAAINELEEDFEDPLTAMRQGKLGKTNAELQACLIKSWKVACQARYLVIHLTEARGANLFLETDWSDGKVVCYPKNPRGIKF
jgi:hypothetical protein